MKVTTDQYPPTKPSGIPWLGEVPAHWEVKRLKHLARKPIKNGAGEAADHEDPEWPRYIRITDIAGPRSLNPDSFRSLPPTIAREAVVEKNDLLLAAVGATYGKSYFHTDDRKPACYAGYLVRYSPGPSVVPEFMAYWTESASYWDQLRSQVIQSTIQNFSSGRYQELIVLLPPLPEQRVIAAFLDERTARIDGLVARKKRLVQLLKERRQALITRAVTRGLDANVALKPSGVPWLGEVPVGWEVKELKYLIGPMEQGWSPQCDNYPADENEWGVLKAGCVNGTSLNERENKRLPDHEQPIPSLEIKPGDILMSRANTKELIGSCGYVEKVRPRLILCDKLYRFHAVAGVSDGRYLVHFLRSHAGRSFMEQNTSGASDSMQNIGQDIVRNIVMPCPPIKEQEAIVAFISEQTLRIDALITKVEAAMERLQEYRSALISAAVTGKVKVPERVAKAIGS